MGEWKAQISIRVRQDLRIGLEDQAARERRKLGNLGEVLLEWAFEQLQSVGSTERLLRYRIRRDGREATGLSPRAIESRGQG